MHAFSCALKFATVRASGFNEQIHRQGAADAFFPTTGPVQPQLQMQPPTVERPLSTLVMFVLFHVILISVGMQVKSYLEHLYHM